MIVAQQCGTMTVHLILRRSADMVVVDDDTHPFGSGGTVCGMRIDRGSWGVYELRAKGALICPACQASCP